MAVTDLTGTTWLFGSPLSVSSYAYYSINFTSNNTAYTQLNIDSGKAEVEVYYGTSLVYEDLWVDDAYKTISITGGTDATNASLISFIEANATQVVQTNDIDISYNGDVIASMNASGTKTLETEGTFCTSDITVVYTKPPAPTPALQNKYGISPTTSSQTIRPDSGYDGLGSVQINAISPIRTSSNVTVSGATVTIPYGYYSSGVSKSVASGTAGTPTATKGTVSNHAVSVTPSVTNTTGYITGGTKTGTAVSVSASELVSGTKSITENGTGIDVTNYASVDVNVSGGSGTEQLYIFVETSSMLNTEALVGEYDYLAAKIAYCGSALVQGASVTLYTYGDYILNTVTGETSGDTIPYTTVTRGTYTFTMPNESVYCSLYYDD